MDEGEWYRWFKSMQWEQAFRLDLLASEQAHIRIGQDKHAATLAILGSDVNAVVDADLVAAQKDVVGRLQQRIAKAEHEELRGNDELINEITNSLVDINDHFDE